MMSHKLKILAGLGNPGAAYAGHRHNVGYWLLDAIIKQYDLTPKESPGYFSYQWHHDYGTSYLLRPKSYMNETGLAVRQLMQYYKIDPCDIWVAYDDMDFEPGCIRVKKTGGAGGHNGIKSVISHVGPAFNRLRFGVDRPQDASRVKSYVLTSPSSGDREKIYEAISIAIESIDLLLQGKYDEYTEKLHLLTK